MITRRAGADAAASGSEASVRRAAVEAGQVARRAGGGHVADEVGAPLCKACSRD